jgi:hypothetical protein
MHFSIFRFMAIAGRGAFLRSWSCNTNTNHSPAPRPARVDLRKRQSAIDPYVPSVWLSSSLNIYILSSIVISHLNNYTNSLSESWQMCSQHPESLREMAATRIPARFQNPLVRIPRRVEAGLVYRLAHRYPELPGPAIRPVNRLCFGMSALPIHIPYN